MANNKTAAISPADAPLEIAPATGSNSAAIEIAAELAPPVKKRDALIAMLRRDDGASIEELSETFGWLAHSTRSMLTGLRKAGHSVERSKQGSVTIYRLVA